MIYHCMINLIFYVLCHSLLSPPAKKHSQFATLDQISIQINLWDESNQPTAARVRLTNLQGEYFAPEGHSADFPLTFSADQEAVEMDVMLANERRFAYVEGQVKWTLPPSAYRLEVIKGYRYSFVDDTLSFDDNRTLDIHLEHAFELPDEQWFSGDVHVHHINPQSALLEMKAEDLNVCNLLISDFTKDHHLFRGSIEPISDSLHLLFLGQEYREDKLGHVDLLNLTEGLVNPADRMRKYQYPLNSDASDYVREQGGHISWAHFAAWPGLEGPLGLVLKKVDAVELLCTIDPFQPPIFVEEVVPEIEMNSGLRLWYRLLNCGLNVPITGGTDKMGNLVTVGANRVYAHLDQGFTYANWVDALNEGRTFVTNNPFLVFLVNGNEIGSRIEIENGDSVSIQAKVWSQLPLDRLDIIANGELVASTQIPEGESYAEIQLDYASEESVWLAARAYRHTGDYVKSGVNLKQRRNVSRAQTLFNQYFGTLRAEVPFAHSSPTYLLVDGKPIYQQEDANYFVHYLDNVMTWLEKQGSFPSAEARKEVLAKFQEGKEAFQSLGQ